MTGAEIMQAAVRDFWLYPLDGAEQTWLAALAGPNSHLLRHPRVRGRANAAFMKRFRLAPALRPITDPLLRRLALLDAAATQRLVWLAGLCLARRSLQQIIDRERRGWVLEVVGEDMPFLLRRGALLWREEGSDRRLAALASSAELHSALLTLGVEAFAAVLAQANDRDAMQRLMLRLPAQQAMSASPAEAPRASALRRLFEKLIEL